MFYPSLAEVQSLSAHYSLIPVRMVLLADQETPIRLYQKIRTNDSFLLESVEGGARWARYSFIGMRPFQIIEAKGTKVVIRDRTGHEQEQEGNPVLILREHVERYKSPKLPQLPRLSGGAVGFFGYNTLHYFEDLPRHRKERLDVPDMRFLFVDEIVAFDHLKQEIQLIVNLHVEAEDTSTEIAAKYEVVCQRLRELAAEVTAPYHDESRVALSDQPIRELDVEANMTRSEFESIVERAKEYIAAGDIFQVVLSQRFQVKTDVDPFSVYRVLRTLNPSPYMYYLQFGEETIAGTSPELLVRVEDRKVEMRPIAGTRKRGATPLEDLALAEDLLADSKERSEHYMLLDLGRNDVGKVSDYGSVRVEEQLMIEHYSHVMHMVSHVTGQLRDGLHPFDALLSAFPAGTVSGAPKLRAMEIIAELEPEARHTYAGAIGYISFHGALDTCITIRTLLFKDNCAYVQAGAGIVADSVPHHEYQETVNKAAGMLSALKKAEQLFVRKEEQPC
ncbi:anthranilate synthase component I [Brevibacillus sp. H7]|uniref:anthranilate synthase component I n=1 Tax=Brevibacillus sp. H7 TaxID=3349138 RepID=UPI003816A89B